MAQGVRAVVWQSEGCRFDPTLGMLKCPWARRLTPNCSWRAGWYLAWQPIAVGVWVCVCYINAVHLPFIKVCLNILNDELLSDLLMMLWFFLMMFPTLCFGKPIAWPLSLAVFGLISQLHNSFLFCNWHNWLSCWQPPISCQLQLDSRVDDESFYTCIKKAIKYTWLIINIWEANYLITFGPLKKGT